MEHFSLAEWVSSSFYALLAAAAGFLGYTKREMDKGAPWKWQNALVETASSGLVGFLIMQLCQTMGLESGWTGLIVGVSGWLGAAATIQILEYFARDKLGLGKDAEK